MSAHLPRPSTTAGAASGCTVIRGKIGITTQRQRERAMLLAQVDKSHEPAINKTRANSNHEAPATPSSVECALRLLQCSAMKQIDVSLHASTMAPILELPSTIPELPTTVKGVASPKIPPTVERVAGGEQHGVVGGGR